jgi:hypothetical protein
MISVTVEKFESFMGHGDFASDFLLIYYNETGFFLANLKAVLHLYMKYLITAVMTYSHNCY